MLINWPISHLLSFIFINQERNTRRIISLLCFMFLTHERNARKSCILQINHTYFGQLLLTLTSSIVRIMGFHQSQAVQEKSASVFITYMRCTFKIRHHSIMKESNILEEIHLLYPTHMISMDILFKSTLLTSNLRNGI